MRKNPRRILSPQRLPFRHPGKRNHKPDKLKGLDQYAKLGSCSAASLVSVVVSVEVSVVVSVARQRLGCASARGGHTARHRYDLMA